MTDEDSLVRSLDFIACHCGKGNQDATQVARIATLMAIRSWDPAGGASLKTWATTFAKAAVRSWWVVERKGGITGLGRNPPPDVLDLDAACGEDGTTTLSELVPDRRVSVRRQVLGAIEVDRLLAALPERDRRVVRRTVLDEEDDEVVGLAEGCGRTRIWQIRRRSLKRMRRAMPDDYEE